MRHGPWQDPPAPAVESLAFGVAFWGHTDITGSWPWASGSMSVLSTEVLKQPVPPALASLPATRRETGTDTAGMSLWGWYLWGWTPPTWEPDLPEGAIGVEFDGPVDMGPVTVVGGIAAAAEHVSDLGEGPVGVTQAFSGKIVHASDVTRSGLTVTVPPLSPTIVAGWDDLAEMSVPAQDLAPSAESTGIVGVAPEPFEIPADGDLSIAMLVSLIEEVDPPAFPAPDSGRRHVFQYWAGNVDLAARALVTRPRYRFLYSSGGAWRLRQRQSLTGTDSWPLRQRQNGGATGSWPLRQRQRGV